MSASLMRYRVMAYIVGVLLLLLVFVHIPLRYVWHTETPIATIHGWVFMVYLVTVLDLSLRCKWQLFPRTFLIMLAGTVPFFSFYAEHKATGWAREAMAGQDVRVSDPRSTIADN
jgi:integral membrane protein